MKELNELEKIMFRSSGNGLKPYEWMVLPTRQQQWIDDKGIFLWLAFFFSEIGAGLYFVSMFYEYKAGLILGWLITLVLGGFIHVLYLGKPMRAWRMIMKPQTSELSRGIWIIGIYAVFGFLQMVTGSFNIVLNTISGILCLLIISHGFATMNVVRALPAWSSTMVLPLSIVSGIWVGQQVLQFMVAVSGSAAMASGMEIWAETFFFAYFLCVLLYAWGTYHSDDIGKASIVMQATDDELKKITWIGVGGLGIVLPLLFTLIMWGGDTNGVLIFLRLACVFAGDLALRYVIMKSALYKPLLTRQ
ncbi:DMSO reductase [Desulfobacula sp.]|uniref:DMSO reductase n=1 Tax=Desulfobacula sp. TaxID=2593537 RepID=UPI0026385851|nr:DMSO reductase [Desulfobacula sp.]